MYCVRKKIRCDCSVSYAADRSNRTKVKRWVYTGHLRDLISLQEKESREINILVDNSVSEVPPIKFTHTFRTNLMHIWSMGNFEKERERQREKKKELVSLITTVDFLCQTVQQVSFCSNAWYAKNTILTSPFNYILWRVNFLIMPRQLHSRRNEFRQIVSI